MRYSAIAYLGLAAMRRYWELITLGFGRSKGANVLWHVQSTLQFGADVWDKIWPLASTWCRAHHLFSGVSPNKYVEG